MSEASAQAIRAAQAAHWDTRAVAWTCGLLAALLGLAALAGGLLAGGVMRSWLPPLQPMAASTALALVPLGLAIVLHGRAPWPTRVLVLLALLPGLLRLASATDPLAGAFSPRPMPMTVAVTLACLAVALLWGRDRPGRRPLQAQWLALLASLPVLGTMLMYVVGAPHGLDALASVQMAPEGAFGLLLCIVGVLGLWPRRGMMRVITDGQAGGVLVRRQLLWMSVIVPLLGYAHLTGAVRGLYNEQAADMFFGMGLLACLATVLWWSGLKLMRGERQGARLEATRVRLLHSLGSANAQLQARDRERGRFLQVIADNTPWAMFYLDQELRLGMWNRTYALWMGCAPDQAPGISVRAVMGEEQFLEAEPYLRRALAGETLGYERVLHGRGGVRTIRVEVVPDRDEDGVVRGMFGAADDVTDLRQREADLRETEARFRSAFDFAPIGVTLTSLAGRYLQVNRAFCQMVGYRRDELLAMHFRELTVDTEDLAEDRRLLEGFLRGEHDTYGREKRIRHRDGHLLWVRVDMAAVRDADGRPIHLIGQIQDVSERRRAAEALAHGADLLRRTERSALVGGWEWDAATGQSSWTEGFARLHDWDPDTPADLVAAQALLSPADRARLRTALKASARDGTAWEMDVPVTTARARRLWVRLRGEGRMRPEGALLFGTMQDITARREAEQALRQSEARFRSLIELGVDWYWEQDAEFRFTKLTYTTRRRPESLGLEPNLGQRRWEILDTRLECPDVDWAGHIAACERHEGFRDFQYPRLADGREVWTSVSGEPIFDGQGVFRGYRGVGRDITEELQVREELRRHRDRLAALVEERTAELRSARDSAERANKAKSEFLANMSHELRTPMHAILSFARLGVDRVEAGNADPARLGQYLRRIDEGGERLLLLLNDLLDLAKLEAGAVVYRMREVELAVLVRDALAEFGELARSRGVTVELREPVAPGRAWCDGDRVGQVLRNLLSNALKFTPQGREVAVRIVADTLPPPPGTLGQGTRAALQVRVCDQGTGVPDGELEAIFDKFVQSSKTRSGAGGTGLGLSICREIIDHQGGRIWAEHNPGGGTCVCFVLPCTPADARAQGTAGAT